MKPPVAEPVLPDYGGGSIVNVAASILRAFDVDAPTPPLRADLADADNLRGPGGIVLLVLDALGESQLRSALAADCMPHLSARLADAAGGLQRITSIFPSTTTVALNSLATACVPAEHGILGHFLWLEEWQQMVNMLTLHPVGADAPIDESRLRRVPTLYERLARAGVPSTAITESAYEGTPFTNLIVEGAAFAGYDGLSQIPFHLERTLAAHRGRPTVTTLYWPLVDKLSHLFGPDHEGAPSPACRWEMQFVDLLIDRVAGLCARHGCTLMLIADHGQVRLDPQQAVAVDGPFREALARHPGGGRRAMYFDGVDAEAVHRRFADQGPAHRVATRREAIDGGWFGGDCAGIESRVGDVILLAGEGCQLLYDYGRGAHPQHGSHAGQTSHEMHVPFILWPAGA